eukprot:406806_1
MSVQVQEEFKKRNKNEVVVKVGMLGDAQVGKRTFVHKWAEDEYIEDRNYLDTLGVDFHEKRIELKNVSVTISLWNLGQQREFATLMPLVCSDAKVMFFCFDLTQKQTLFSVKRWYKEARKENKIFMPFLIGLKFDLFDELKDHHKQDITKQARKFAKKMHSPLIYVSSAQSINVKKTFKIVLTKVFDLNPKVKEAHDATKEAIIEFNVNESDEELYDKYKNSSEEEEDDKKKQKARKKEKNKGYDEDIVAQLVHMKFGTRRECIAASKQAGKDCWDINAVIKILKK